LAETPQELELASDAQLVSDAVTAREEAEATEAEASPSRWREADRYAELSRRGWGQRQIADQCGTNQTTVSRFIRCAESVPTHQREAFWDSYASITGEKTTGEKLVASDENEWYTPARYLDAAREVLGGIDLDPASSEEANKRVRATSLWTADDDGLEQPWHGHIWLNPPYGGLAEKFTQRLVAEHAAASIEAAVLLVNAHCTDTKWFQPLWNQPLCFTDHRIDFEAPQGREKKTSSTHGSVFGYFGPHPERFAAAFVDFGAIVSRWSS
jgi:phage N-6-adenine-methyltransferase